MNTNFETNFNTNFETNFNTNSKTNAKIQVLASNIIKSIERAFQYISYSHSEDFINAMIDAYIKEENAAAKNAILQILENSKLSAQNHRPLCQDTGIATIFCKLSNNVEIVNDIANNDSIQTLTDMINEGVKIAYSNKENPLRFSVLKSPASERINTKNNTPAIIHYDFVNDINGIEFICAAKGGGSEAKAKFAMLNPSDSVEKWVLEQIPKMGAGWCPPGVLGIGIGGTPEKAMLLAKEALMQPVSNQQEFDLLRQKISSSNANFLEKLRINLLDKINALGIGAQGLGGLTTVLDVKIKEFPTHAANLPIAIIPNCAATRHCHFTLNNDNKVFEVPEANINAFDKLNSYSSQNSQQNSNDENCLKLNVDDSNLTREKLKQLNLKIGQKILLSGTIYTARDAAHKRLCDLLENNKPLPINLDNKFLYYVGPVDPVNDEIVGSAGPTTATRMDKFMQTLLSKTQLLGSIGKAERSAQTADIIKQYDNVYLIAVGGAAYLISKSIKSAKVVAFEDLGMEAIYEFVVENFPVIVAVDSEGNNIHQQAPKQWQKIIFEKNNK